MQNTQEILNTFVLLWAVIDPIGTVPVFIAATGPMQNGKKLP